MKAKAAFIFGALVSAFFGICLTFFPAWSGDLFDLEYIEDSILVTRLFGAALVGNAVILWQVNDDSPSEARRNIILGEIFHSGIASVIWIMAIIQGLGNILTWIPALCHIILTVWFGYLYIKGAK